jgi:Cys-rich protein (TIGR01571 family)
MTTPGENPKWDTALCDFCCNCKGTFECVKISVFPWYCFAGNVKEMQSEKTSSVPKCEMMPACIPIVAGGLYFAGFYGAIAASFATGSSAFGLFFGLPVLMHAALRYDVRQRFKIQSGCCDNCCGDFCCALWCYSCSIQQEKHQLAKLHPDPLTAATPTNSMFESVQLLPSNQFSLKQI